MTPEEKSILRAIASENFVEATRLAVRYCAAIDQTNPESLARGIGFLDEALRTARTFRAHMTRDAEVVAGLRRLGESLESAEPEVRLVG